MDCATKKSPEQEALDAILPGEPGNYEGVWCDENGENVLVTIYDGVILEGGVFAYRENGETFGYEGKGRLCLMTRLPTGRKIGNFQSERIARLAARDLLAVPGVDWHLGDFGAWQARQDQTAYSDCKRVIRNYLTMGPEDGEAAV